jgi:glutaredoxin-like protein NrdH
MFRAARTKDIVAALGWFLLAAGISWIVVTYVRNPSFFASKVETGDWHQLLGEPASSRVLIFGLPTCPACQETKALLDRHCVAYHDRDVGTPGAVRRQFERLESRSVPVTVIGNRKITGHHPDEILDALDAAGIAVGKPGSCSVEDRAQRSATTEPRTT